MTNGDHPLITIGMVVHYCMTERDCNFLKHQRMVGNEPQPGSVYPAIAVHVWSTREANLQVFLDGRDTYWAPGCLSDSLDGNEHARGTWRWPSRT